MTAHPRYDLANVAARAVLQIVADYIRGRGQGDHGNPSLQEAVADYLHDLFADIERKTFEPTTD